MEISSLASALGEMSILTICLVALAVICKQFYSYVCKKDEEAERIRKETIQLNSEREAAYKGEIDKISDNMKAISDTLKNVNEVNRELATSNKLLTGKLNDNIVELKEDIDELKHAISDHQ